MREVKSGIFIKWNLIIYKIESFELCIYTTQTRPFKTRISHTFWNLNLGLLQTTLKIWWHTLQFRIKAPVLLIFFWKKFQPIRTFLGLRGRPCPYLRFYPTNLTGKISSVTWGVELRLRKINLKNYPLW